MRISVQESAVWIFEEFRKDIELKSGSNLFGLSTRQTPSRIVVQMGIHTVIFGARAEQFHDMWEAFCFAIFFRARVDS